MQGYRLYFMDAFSGHIDHRRDFLAPSDADAIEIAAGWQGTQPTELWHGARKLKRWEPPEPVAESAFAMPARLSGDASGYSGGADPEPAQPLR